MLNISEGPFPSVCNLTQSPDQIRVTAGYKRPTIFSGCMLGENNPESYGTYIIELLDKPRANQTMIDVELDIKSPSKRPVKHDFCLVLKAQSHVQWKINTKKVQGELDVIANRYVDMGGIRMEPVYVQTEELTDTKENLISWVKSYRPPVVMYAGMEMANKISLTLPIKGKIVVALLITI